MSVMSPEEDQKYKESQRRSSSILGIVLLVVGTVIAANLPSMSGSIQFIAGFVVLFLWVRGVVFIME